MKSCFFRHGLFLRRSFDKLKKPLSTQSKKMATAVVQGNNIRERKNGRMMRVPKLFLNDQRQQLTKLNSPKNRRELGRFIVAKKYCDVSCQN